MARGPLPIVVTGGRGRGSIAGGRGPALPKGAPCNLPARGAPSVL